MPVYCVKQAGASSQPVNLFRGILFDCALAISSLPMPNKMLIVALFEDVIIGTALTFIDIPGIDPLPWWQVITILVYAMASCLFFNDLLKVTMMKG